MLSSLFFVVTSAFLGGNSASTRSVLLSREPRCTTFMAEAISADESLRQKSAMPRDPEWYRPAKLDGESISVGQVVACTILAEMPKSAGGGYAVDIGTALPARVPRSHVALRPNATSRGRRTNFGQSFEIIEPGTVLEGQVIAIGESSVNVSIARHQANVAWKRVTQLAQEDLTVEAKVLRFSENGMTLDVEGLPAFCPWSHYQISKSERTAALIGTSLPIKFLEADQWRSRLVVSNRRVNLDRAMAAIQEGDVVSGVVSSLRDYGAVVALSDGLEGLLHISQISQTFVRDVADVLSPGDDVRCVIIKVEAKDGSISLSTKMLEKRPGDIVRDKKAVFAQVVGSSDGDADGTNA